MGAEDEIVITGMGVISPIGVGSEAFWDSLVSSRGGIGLLGWKSNSPVLAPMGGAVRDFDPARYVRPRKNLKVMSREIQFGVAAAQIACQQADIAHSAVDPDRFGVVFGADMMVTELDELIPAYRACMTDGQFEPHRWGDKALPEMFPLWMLKYLPNMPACHIGIAQDARGPNNSHTLAEASSLTALAEAVRVIQRGWADVMIAGGTSTRIHPLTMARYCAWEMSRRASEAAAACRPFDRDRDGMVLGEGAGAFVLESRRHALARGARILARVLACANAYEPSLAGRRWTGESIRRAIRVALGSAGLSPADIGHVNAHGLSTTEDDRIEASAIRDLLGEVPVTAPKSFFGNLGAGTGAVEMAVSVLALRHKLVPPTVNFEHPDPACPIHVVHGRPLPEAKPVALVLNHTHTGQAVAVLLGSAD